MYEEVEPNSKRWLDLQPLLNEEFRDIPGYGGLYQVSNYGRVKSLERITYLKKNILRYEKEKLIKLHRTDKGYFYVSISKNNQRKTYRLHRLVAKIFILNPNNLPEVNHIDENKDNNCVNNLEWITHIENVRYGTGIIRAIETRYIKISQYDLQNNLIKTWNSGKEIREQYPNIHLWDVLHGKRKTAMGYIWRYRK